MIKHVRENRGFSQKILCQGLCTTATLSRFESGEQSPSWDCVRSILERLGMEDENYTTILFRQSCISL
ncbi:MAG: helix-turn-helix domain-containing protein [Lachnospiraceae bacterium]|nr:helix-turn-helix domain-containing protein [Lachnospiraceae bacterium]